MAAREAFDFTTKVSNQTVAINIQIKLKDTENQLRPLRRITILLSRIFSLQAPFNCSLKED